MEIAFLKPFHLSNISTMWVALEIVVVTFQRLKGINGK